MGCVFESGESVVTVKERALPIEVLAEVERTEGGSVVENYLCDVSLIDLDREEVVLAVPSRFLKQRLEGSKILAALARGFGLLLGAKPAIRVKVDPSLAQAAAVGEESDAVPAPVAAAPKAKKLGLPDDMTLDQFIVGPANRVAFNAAERVCDSPGDMLNPLVITGHDGLGKTHLLVGIARRLRERGVEGNVLFVTGEEFANQFVSGIRSRETDSFRERYRHADAVIIDDLGALASKKHTQIEFLHTFEELLNAQKQIVVSCEENPKRIEKLHPGLRGRLLAGLVVTVEPPDVDTRRRIVEVLSKRQKISLSREVTEFMARNVTRNVGDIVGALKRLQVRAHVGERIDVPCAKRSLGDLLGPKDKIPREELVLKIVAESFSVPGEDLRGGSSRRPIANARQVAMFLMRRLTDLSLTEIGKYFQREPSTVTHADKKIAAAIMSDDGLSRQVEACRERFEDKK